MRQILRVFVGLLFVAVLVGCGPRRPRPGVVSGTITYKGRAVNDATLLLYSAGGDATGAITIPVTEAGTFRISDVPSGEYKIVVQGAEGEGNDASLLKSVPKEKRAEVEKLMAGQRSAKTIPFPKKYQDLTTTDLKCQVTASNQTLSLELKD